MHRKWKKQLCLSDMASGPWARKAIPAAATWHGASDPVQVKKIYSPTTTYANQNPIIPFCLFYLELQNKISHDYVLLKVVMLLFRRQILLPMPYKQVASYFIPYILLASYFLSRTRMLLFLKKILYYNVTFYLTFTKYKSYFFENKSYFLYHINKSQVTSYNLSCILLVCYFMSEPRKLLFLKSVYYNIVFLTFTKYKSYFS